VRLDLLGNSKLNADAVLLAIGDLLEERYAIESVGFSNYTYAVITHPIGSLNPDQIAERAKQALPQVLSILGLNQEPIQPVGIGQWQSPLANS
jgi:hypothetical protein